MAKFIQQSHGISTIIIMVLVMVIMLIILLSRVVPLLASSCNMMVSLIKQRPFIYIILNFIIISLLTSSSFSLILLKFQPRQKHTRVERTTSHVIPFFGDDDTWWVGIVEDTEPEGATWKAASEEEKEEAVEDEVVVAREEQHADVEEEEEEDTLDGTWKAIMEAKGKGGGPQLKKSGTWSHGDRGGGGDGGLKRCRTLKDGGGGKGGGGGGGWKKKEMGLTYHDEFKNRADAFIAQFVNNMRIQRLESDQRFLEMINRGH